MGGTGQLFNLSCFIPPKKIIYSIPVNVKPQGMNRLILVGNGFDLAHGLKTSYNDFIKWYLRKCLRATNGPRYYEDSMISIEKVDYYFTLYHDEGLDGYIDMLYNSSLVDCENDDFPIEGFQNRERNPYKITIKSTLLRVLFSKCSYSTWVEVENDFYQLLKTILKHKREKDIELKDLNDSLAAIIQEQEAYLSEQQPSHQDSRYVEIFNSRFVQGDIVSHIGNIQHPENTMVLNFNYTSTVEEYFKPDRGGLDRKHFSMNYIHGQLNKPDNPMIFGFGDELDEDYRAIELEKTKGFLKFIKSFWYFKTRNYHNLLRFIEADKYQVFILGHSCGLSDRTMLNMLFEHQHCESVKIFYYENGSYNNYEDLTHEISKHLKDKARMRRVIVPRSRSLPMPQVKIIELERDE